MSIAPQSSPPAVAGHTDQEIVERKGLGHPDTIADGIAELCSIRYSQYCVNHFGVVLHHNVDKVAVLGGRAEFAGNAGRYREPVRVLIGGVPRTRSPAKPSPSRSCWFRLCTSSCVWPCRATSTRCSTCGC